MRVICVKWGDKYGPEWVLRLRNMVAKHFTLRHDFVCVTEKPVEGVDCLPLTCDLPGWWQKVSLFQRGRFPGWNLYLDLDVVITANIDALAQSNPSKLYMRDDFSYSLRNPKQGLSEKDREYLGGIGTCNSSVMVWNGDAVPEVWDSFTPEVMQKRHGDQNHISATLYPNKIGFLPDDMVGSYKYGMLRNESVKPVMVFHGNPKMSDLPKGHELRRMWEAA